MIQFNWNALSLVEWVLVGAFLLHAVAMLLHVRKEPKDAHGKNRN